MYSIKDEQTDTILKSGRNSKTKEEALEEAWNYWLEIDGRIFPNEELEKLYKKKEEWLRNIGLKPIEHEEEINR